MPPGQKPHRCTLLRWWLADIRCGDEKLCKASPFAHRRNESIGSAVNGYGYSTWMISAELASATSTDNGRSFSNPRLLTPLPTNPQRRPELNGSAWPVGWVGRGSATIAAPAPSSVVTGQRTLHVFLGGYMDNATEVETFGCWCLRVDWDDATKRYTAERLTSGEPHMNWVFRKGCQGSVATLPSGRLVFGEADYQGPDDGRLFSMHSDTGGRTWHHTPMFAIPRGTEGGTKLEGPGLCEVQIAALTSTDLWMVIRAQHPWPGYSTMDVLWESRSSSSGLTWSSPVARNQTGSRLVGINSPATPLVLRDGRTVLLWNNALSHNSTYPTRQILHASVSDNHGRNFAAGYREIARSLFPGVVCTNATRCALNNTGPAGPEGSARTDFGTAYPVAIETARAGRLLISTGEGYKSESSFQVDVDWILQKEQVADYASPLPKLSPYRWPAGEPACDYPPCAWDGHGQATDPQLWSGGYLTTYGTVGASVVPPVGADGGWLQLAGDEAAAVWNVPGMTKGLLNLTVSFAEGRAGQALHVAVTDHFSMPLDRFADSDSSVSCSAVITPASGKGGSKWQTVSLAWLVGRQPQCHVTGLGARSGASGAGPFEQALSYVRMRPVGNATVRVRRLASGPAPLKTDDDAVRTASFDERAEFAFSAALSSDMVLQREPARARLWGTGQAGAVVAVDVGETYRVTVGRTGRWSLLLPPQPAGLAFGTGNIVASQRKAKGNVTTLRLSGVTFGEVWLCTGQVSADTLRLTCVLRPRSLPKPTVACARSRTWVCPSAASAEGRRGTSRSSHGTAASRSGSRSSIGRGTTSSCG